MDDIELWQLTFDAEEVPYDEAAEKSSVKDAPAFRMHRKSNKIPKGQGLLFDISELDPVEPPWQDNG